MNTYPIIFVTSNKSKFEKVHAWIKELDPSIELIQEPLDLPEYQTLDIKKVALGKALHAWNLLKKPLLIDDGGVFIEQYNQFPGTLSKYVFQSIGLEGIWKLAQNDPRCYFLNILVYIDGPDSYQFFSGKCNGKLIEPKNKVKDLDLPFTEIFVPEGTSKTLSELKGTEEYKKINHRRKSVIDFVQWFSKNKKN